MDEYSASDTATDENGVEMTVRDPEAICDAPAAKEATEDASGKNSADNASKVKSANLERMGILTAIAIGLHNLPEGLATFVAAMDDPAVGAPSPSRSQSTTSQRACASPFPCTTRPTIAQKRSSSPSIPE